MSALLHLLFDHLVRNFGRIPAHAVFGFLFASAFLLPCVALGLYPREAAVLEAVSDGLWMAVAGCVVSIFSGETDDVS